MEQGGDTERVYEVALALSPVFGLVMMAIGSSFLGYYVDRQRRRELDARRQPRM